MQGTTVQVTATAAAIDTGTTLIGGPETDVAALYAAIPGSRKMTGSYAGYYEYRELVCSSSKRREHGG
jgi:cathepsin D